MKYARINNQLKWVVCLSLFISSQALAGSDKFTHQYLTLVLPDGWAVGKVPKGSDKQTIGVLTSKKIKGASITVDCYRGMLQTKASTRIRGLKLLGVVYPKGQEHLKKPYKVKTESGKARAELWRGYLQAGNQTIGLISPMAILKTKNCWLLMIGYTPESTAKELEEDFLEILKSAK